MAEFPGIRGPIAMVTGMYPSLSMTFVDREVRALRAMGCEVLTCTLRQPPADLLSGPYQIAEAEQVVSLFDLVRRPGALFAAWLEAVRQPRRLCAAIRLTLATGGRDGPGLLRQMAYLCAAVVLARTLRRDRVAHVHNHLGDSSGTVALLAADLAGLPFSMTLHGPEIFDEARRWHLREKIARAAFVACISKFGRARAMLHADPQHWPKLEIVRCGVDLTRYPETICEEAGSRLLFVGRLEVRKGVATLIDAMSRLRTRGRAAHLTIVGQGAMRASLERSIAAAGLQEMVTFAGPMDEAGVAEALGRADIVIVPSLSEGLPVVIMEAMACGLPVIASAVDGIPELVTDGVTGLLVPPADADALAERIERLMSDPALRSRLGQAGQQRVRRDHDAGTNARRLLDLMTCHGKTPSRTFAWHRPAVQTVTTLSTH